jgi:glutathione peroxidase
MMGLESIKWNFTKFLVDKDGNVVSRHAPAEKPEDLTGNLDRLL